MPTESISALKCRALDLAHDIDQLLIAARGISLAADGMTLNSAIPVASRDAWATVRSLDLAGGVLLRGVMVEDEA